MRCVDINEQVLVIMLSVMIIFYNNIVICSMGRKAIK